MAMLADVSVKKAKLPRKRKKAAIKAQGRKWYYDTIRMYYLTQRSGRFYEPTCKFWVNASVQMTIHQTQNGKVMPIPTPTKFW